MSISKTQSGNSVTFVLLANLCWILPGKGKCVYYKTLQCMLIPLLFLFPSNIAVKCRLEGNLNEWKGLSKYSLPQLPLYPSLRGCLGVNFSYLSFPLYVLISYYHFTFSFHWSYNVWAVCRLFSFAFISALVSFFCMV